MCVFSENLKNLRIAKFKSQKELSELLGISVRQYQRYEKGEQEPNIARLTKLSNFFEVSIDYLVKGINEQSKIS